MCVILYGVKVMLGYNIHMRQIQQESKCVRMAKELTANQIFD